MVRGGRNGDRDAARGYLCVDDFLRTLVDARAVAAALELGLVETLSRGGACSASELAVRLRADGRGMELLLDLLCGNGVLEDAPGGFRITRRFRDALSYRDLLEAKLAFARMVLPDLVGGFSDLIRSPPRFMQASRVFALFDYSRAEEDTPRNREHTRRWMRITTAWTRYEAGVCLAHHDFGPHRRVLDIGGNSGELVLQICRRHSALHGTVLDLPVVCRIGREHVHGEPEADRIAFHEADALRDDLPQGFDLVVFKSTLHDWPDAEARTLLDKAEAALVPGGTLLIFERGPLGRESSGRSFASLPFLLFAPWFRPPALYVEHLDGLGFEGVQEERIELDTPFFLIRARKPGRTA